MPWTERSRGTGCDTAEREGRVPTGEVWAPRQGAVVDAVDKEVTMDGLRHCVTGKAGSHWLSRCSHSWCNYVAIRLPICGTTMVARPTRSGREKEESRAILLCPCCMLSGSTKLCDQCNLASVHTRDSWLSTMMCTPLHSQTGLWRSTGFWVRSCGSTAAFGSMPARPRSGTGVAMSPAGT